MSVERARPVPRTYTHSPLLHPNFWLGGFQLLGWVFFHPSAWRNYIAYLEPTLRPDFSLAELRLSHWQKARALRRIIGQLFSVGSLVIVLGVALTLWGAGFSVTIIVTYVIVSLSIGLAITLMFSLVNKLGVSVGIGITIGLMYGILSTLIGSFMRSTEGRLAIVVAGGIAGNLSITLANPPSQNSLAKQVGSVVMGVAISSLAIGIGFKLINTSAIGVTSGITNGALSGLASGIINGIAIGWNSRRWQPAVLYGFGLGVIVTTNVLIINLTPNRLLADALNGMNNSIWVTSFFVLSYGLAKRVAGPIAGAVAGALGIGWVYTGALYFLVPLTNNRLSFLPALPFITIGVFLGLTLSWWRPVVLYPVGVAWNFLLYRADRRRAGQGNFLSWNSAFWDEHQRCPLFGLDDHLLLLMERDSDEVQAALEYLMTTHQRWAVRVVQIEVEINRLERCHSVEAISRIHHTLAAGELPGPASSLLRAFSRLSYDVEAALQQESAYNQRLALVAVEDRLDILLREISRSNDIYTVRFHPLAGQWRQIVAQHITQLAGVVELRQEIDNPYIVGVPLTERQKIFVGRAEASAYLEALILREDRSPLLLYGQRRMGKTSLLNNLGRLLPTTITPFLVDLQGPVAMANNDADFFYSIARNMVESAKRQRGLRLPLLSRAGSGASPFSRFDEWLDEIEKVMEAEGQSTALLNLDEFETLDSALNEGRFSATAVLGMLRHIIQHRPRFRILLAGSHTLDELERWASYLINVQVMRISYLQEAEARQLIEQPVENFALRYTPEASQEVINLTWGHPYLVQLLCAEIITLKNSQPLNCRRQVTLPDVLTAVPEALQRGSFFFADIQRNQVTPEGLTLLRVLAAQGAGAVLCREALLPHLPNPAELENVLTSLARRELIEQVDTGYRFQVELIRRWFVNGHL